MGKYANFYDGVRKLLDKIADALDPDSADVKTANYQTAVLNSLERIGDKVGDVVSATLPDASTATDGDTLVVADGEWTIGSGGGGGGAVVIRVEDMPYLAQALNGAVMGAITTGVTTYPNAPFLYKKNVDSEDIVNEINMLSDFLTENEGSTVYIYAEGDYQPIVYSTTSVSLRMNGQAYGVGAYSFIIFVGQHFLDETVIGARFNIYGFVTSNIVESN